MSLLGRAGEDPPKFRPPSLARVREEPNSICPSQRHFWDSPIPNQEHSGLARNVVGWQVKSRGVSNLQLPSRAGQADRAASWRVAPKQPKAEPLMDGLGLQLCPPVQGLSCVGQLHPHSSSPELGSCSCDVPLLQHTSSWVQGVRYFRLGGFFSLSFWVQNGHSEEISLRSAPALGCKH